MHEAVADAFEAAFVGTHVGAHGRRPDRPGTDVGPLATEPGRDDIEEHVADAVAKGAVVAVGARDRPARLVLPADGDHRHHPGMRMFNEEVFGPVASMYRVADLDEAIEIANATAFGLGSNAWTTTAEQDRFIDELEAGAVFINGMTSYPELPFGGVKRSGYGRELVGTRHPRVLQPEDRLDQRSIGRVRRARMRREAWPPSPPSGELREPALGDFRHRQCGAHTGRTDPVVTPGGHTVGAD